MVTARDKDERIAELLEANNRYMERARAAEAESDRVAEINRKLVNDFNNLLIHESRTEDRAKAAEARVAALEALCDSLYIAGMKAGWNFCVSDDHAGYASARGNSDHIKTLIATDRERSPHLRFHAYRLNGEWFRKDGDLDAWIKEGCPQ